VLLLVESHDHLACSFPEAYERLFPGLGNCLGSVKSDTANNGEMTGLGLQVHSLMCTDPCVAFGADISLLGYGRMMRGQVVQRLWRGRQGC